MFPGIARHSILSASMGETAAARLAGMTAAKKEHVASAAAARASATGSQKDTPYNWAEMRRPAPTASGNPASNPMDTR